MNSPTSDPTFFSTWRGAALICVIFALSSLNYLARLLSEPDTLYLACFLMLVASTVGMGVLTLRRWRADRASHG